MASQNIIRLTDDNFESEVINSDVPVLVDFWAEWCMPCRMLAPIIDEIAAEFDGKIKVGKVDTDEARDTALKYNISAIPTVILIKDGMPVKQFVGMQQKSDIVAGIEDALQD